MRCFGVGLLSLACLAALGHAKGPASRALAKKAEPAASKSKVKETPAATSWQVFQFGSNLTVAPQGGNFVVVTKEYSNDFQVYQCDGSPCLPSELTSEPANVSVDLYQGWGKFKVWIPEVPEEYQWSLGWKVTLGLDPSLDQRLYRATVNGQDALGDFTEEGELALEPSEGGQSIEVEVLSLKSGAFSKCAWDGEDCYEGKCCMGGGMTCYLKDEYWGMCRPTGSCTAGIDEADGQNWDCTDVGSKPDVEPLPPALKDEDRAGSSLFCFVVSTPLTYDEGLVKAQKKAGAGVFGCDKSAVYTGAEADEKTEAMVMKDWLAIWDEVKHDGLWKKADWTLKAEADAVFSPARLRARLDEQSPWAGVPIYFKNTREGDGLPTPLMLFSSKAVEMLLSDKQDCKGKVERRKGESFYLATCLDASGAAHMLDEGLIDDRRSGEEHAWDLTDTSMCSGEYGVAYRPFQQAKHWLECSEKAEEAASQAASKLLRDRL